MKILRITIITSLICVFLFGCYNSEKNNNFSRKQNKTSDRTCSNELFKFARSLEIDSSKFINYYFVNTSNLGQCNFDHLRGSDSLKASVVLIMLKLHNNYLLKKEGRVLAFPISGISKFSSKIINEYAFLYYGKDIYFEEKLFVDDIISLIKRQPNLLKVKEIEKEFSKALRLKKS